MAVDSVWGKPSGSAWADDVDEQEQSGNLAAPVAFGKEEAFPSLSAAVKEAPKKKKAQKLSLNQFLSAGAGGGSREDAAILSALPKSSSGAPREERGAGGLGGAFKEYGGDRGGFRRGFDRDGEEGERGGRGRREQEPSRADEADDWGANRKYQPSEPGASRGFGGGFRDRGGDREGGGFGDRLPRRDAAPSAADEVDDWGANRKFQPSSDGERRGGGSFGGGGFRDREGADRPPRAGGRFDEPSRADTDDWGTRRAPAPAPEERAGPSGRRPGFGFGGSSSSAADNEDRWTQRGPPAGAGTSAAAAAPPSSSGPEGTRERPRLNLAPRTKPVETSAPASPSQANGTGEGEKDKEQQQQAKAPKSNPFGAARPREEVLKEKGIDYVKEELKLEHGEVIRDKTPEEEDLEKEVEALRTQLEGMKELQSGEEDTLRELEADLDAKEKSLYKLQAELDDKVRFSKNRPEERRPPPEAQDDRGFERAGPRRPARPADEGEQQQQQERGGERAGGSSGGRGLGGPREERGPAAGRGGGGGFRDREAGRGPRGPPPGERRTPAW